jgi:hypothetical protein
MIGIAARVSARWDELRGQSSKPSIVLVFSSPADPSVARASLQEAVTEVVRSFDEREDLPDGYDEIGTGVWTVGHSPDGVILQVGEKCEAFHEMLDALARRLERRGVEGSFDLHEPRALEEPPIGTDLLECRLRVRGERFHRRFAIYGWRSDPDALWEIVLAGERWCSENVGVGARWLKVGLLPAVSVTPADNPCWGHRWPTTGHRRRTFAQA